MSDWRVPVGELRGRRCLDVCDEGTRGREDFVKKVIGRGPSDLSGHCAASTHVITYSHGFMGRFQKARHIAYLSGSNCCLLVQAGPLFSQGGHFDDPSRWIIMQGTAVMSTGANLDELDPPAPPLGLTSQFPTLTRHILQFGLIVWLAGWLTCMRGGLTGRVTLGWRLGRGHQHM